MKENKDLEERGEEGGERERGARRRGEKERRGRGDGKR